MRAFSHIFRKLDGEITEMLQKNRLSKRDTCFSVIKNK